MSNSNFYIYSNFSDLSVEMLTVTDTIYFLVHCPHICVSRSSRNFLYLGHTSTVRAETAAAQNNILIGKRWAAAGGQVARAWKSHKRPSYHVFPRQAVCSAKTLCTFLLLQQDLQASPVTLPEDGIPTLMASWGALRSGQLLTHNPGSGHLCKKLFPQGRRVEVETDYAQRTAFSLWTILIFSCSTQHSRAHNTESSILTAPAGTSQYCQCLGLMGQIPQWSLSCPGEGKPPLPRLASPVPDIPDFHGDA